MPSSPMKERKKSSGGSRAEKNRTGGSCTHPYISIAYTHTQAPAALRTERRMYYIGELFAYANPIEEGRDTRAADETRLSPREGHSLFFSYRSVYRGSERERARKSEESAGGARLVAREREMEN